ncbi:MAG: DUF4149 domain-containing protein [Chromatiales bacterium]|jgi:hypothetical protein
MPDWVELETLAGLALAAVFGGMLIFSAVLAPLVFTRLPADAAGPFIRAVFPRYYLVLGGLSLVAALALTASAGPFAWETAVVAAVVLAFVLARQGLMPWINRESDLARDGDPGARHRFNRLHRLSVIVNGLQMFAVAVVLVRLIAY